MGTVAAFLSRLQRRLGDEGPYFTSTDGVDWASEAQRDIALRLSPQLLPGLQAVETGTLTTNEFGCGFTSPTDVAQAVSLAIYNATNRDKEVRLMSNASYKGLKQNNVFFQADDKQYFGYMEAERYYIEPGRVGEMYRFRYVESPGDKVSTNEMDLQDRWEDLALDYAQYLAFMKEGNGQGADQAYKKYLH